MFERYKKAQAIVKEQNDRTGLTLVNYVLIRVAIAMIALGLGSGVAQHYGWLLLAGMLSVLCTFLLFVIAVGVVIHVVIDVKELGK